MASTKIKDLPATASVAGTDLLILDQASQTSKVSVDDFVSKAGVAKGTDIQTLRTDLSNTGTGKGGQLVGFSQGTSGSVGRTVSDKLKEYVSVKDFGVKMDGATDDTAALNLAFSSGMPVSFPSPKNSSEFCLITGTLKIPSGCTIKGAGKYVPVIKCSATMSGDISSLVTSNYANGVLSANTNISISDLYIDNNGFNRSGTMDGYGIVLNAENSQITNVTSARGTKWNLFVTSGNPFALIGHAVDNTAPSKNIILDNFTSIDPIAGDGAIIQGLWGGIITNYTSLFTSALTTKVRADAGLQIIEGCRDIAVDGVYLDHSGSLTTGVSVSCHVNKPHLRNISIKRVVGYNLNTLVGVFNDTSSVAITSDSWLTKGLTVSDITLNYPVVDSSSTVMQARILDVQNMKDFVATNITTNISKPDGTYSCPTTIVNLDGVRNGRINGIFIKGAPVITQTLNVPRASGWIMLRNANNQDIQISNIHLENQGYFNRVISDTTSNALSSVDGLRVDILPSDSQTKEAIVSGSATAEVKGVSLPTGMTLGRVTSAFSAVTGDNIQVMQSSPKRLFGSTQMRAINVSNVQTAPTLVLERGYVGTGGKGNLAFWTSAATLGTLGVGAWSEESSTFTPIHITAYQPSNSITKYLSPAVDGDTNLGNASSAWLNGYFKNAPQTTSDARLKTEVRTLTDAEISAGKEIAKTLGFWRWKDNEGDREHAGTTVQNAIKIMEQHGLTAFDYSFICYDKWEDIYEDVWDTDSEGNIIEDSKKTVQTQVAGDKYSFRVQELSLYLLACICA